MSEIRDAAIKHFRGLQSRYEKTHNGTQCAYVKMALEALEHPEAETDFGKNNLVMEPANETSAAYTDETEAWLDRQAFVRNLGVLLSQTREGVVSAELGEDEIVTITYRGGGTHLVNVNMDSYAAIVHDVAKNVG